MIDSHCHLEQPDYDKDRDELIERCKQELLAIITSCANPKYFDLTMQLVKRHKGFIFATASVHPGYVREIEESEMRQYFDRIKSNRDNIVAIGETGLDYYWIKEAEWQKKQKKLFLNLISLAKQLRLPLVIHSRNATEEAMQLLEQHGVKRVQMHMFTERSLLNRAVENGWSISVNTLLLRSKNIQKIVRSCQLERILLESDAPWLGIDLDGNIKRKHEVINEPMAISYVVNKIADIKKVDAKDVDNQTTENTIKFFGLKI